MNRSPYATAFAVAAFIVRQIIAQWHIPGLSLAVVDRGRVRMSHFLRGEHSSNGASRRTSGSPASACGDAGTVER